jgi:hypothetical protein
MRQIPVTGSLESDLYLSHCISFTKRPTIAVKRVRTVKRWIRSSSHKSDSVSTDNWFPADSGLTVRNLKVP